MEIQYYSASPVATDAWENCQVQLLRTFVPADGDCMYICITRTEFWIYEYFVSSLLKIESTSTFVQVFNNDY